ncbi:MAG: KamA family radical SAM protein [Planctomycetota bacterium]
MVTASPRGITPRTYRAYTRKDLERIPQLQSLSPEARLEMQAVSAVLPFKVNSYIIDRLIDWEDIPDDPIFQLTFPQAGMLEPQDLRRMVRLVREEASDKAVQEAARRIQRRLNPHPAGQLDLNVPQLDGERLPGFQHKYRETVLFFPQQGQTCHAYCTYCFRWAQFVGIDELKFAQREASTLANYVAVHPEVQSVLFTGGDPLIMKSSLLRRYIEPLLAPELEHLVSIRLGTKSTTYWPYRFLTDPDADDLLRLFESVVRAGHHLSIMAHVSHPRELETREAQMAVRRILRTGAAVRCQAPLIRHVNDSARLWSEMWQAQIRLGAVPYYMFVERDTGPKGYFDVPLARAFEIYTRATRRVSGLARTVRGPSMSATPGKVVVDAVADVAGEQVFVLKFLQARDPAWVNRVFFAAFDPAATWLTDLRPAFGEQEFFFEPAMEALRRQGGQSAWGQPPGRRAKASQFGHVEWE